MPIASRSPFEHAGRATPAAAFARFPSLPAELRLKIWNLIIDPRVLFYRRRIRTCVPPILHVCRESRQEGLLHYQLIECIPSDPSPVYFDFEIDTLHPLTHGLLVPESLDFMIEMPAFDKVQHLAFLFTYWHTIVVFPSFLKFLKRIRTSQELKTITIISYGEKYDHMGKKLIYKESPSLPRWLRNGNEDHPEWNSPVFRIGRVDPGS